jgi:trimeric autotransporter adhesin
MRTGTLSAAIFTCQIVSLAALAAQEAASPPPWRQVAYVKASNPGAFDHFGEGGALDGHTGNAVAISADGNTIAVGARHEGGSATGINGNPRDDSAYDAGAVYVFIRAGNTWEQQAYIKASNAESGDHFGNVVALSADGNTLAVGALWESSAATGVNGNQNDNSVPQAGAVYVFTRDGANWTQQAYLKASNTGRAAVGDAFGDGDQFGFSLALSQDGNTLAVGAVAEDSAAEGMKSNPGDDSFTSAGAVYVFARTGSTWAAQTYLKADASTNTALGDQFGYAVSLSANGNTLAVGVYDESGSGRAVNAPIDRQRMGSGAVYIFGRASGTWTREAYLKTWNAEGGDSWGTSVSLSADGNTLAVGSLDEDCLCPGIHSDPGVGAVDQKSDTSAGAAAIFVRSGTTWMQQAYIKPSNPGSGDWFGVRLALSADGDTLAVGAQNEDGSTRRINGASDDDATEAGAIYLFTRTGSTWTQLSYVKGSNTEAYDEFGGSVALSRDGRTLVGGARGEDSGVAGRTGNESDNSLDESGAVYVFTR